MIRTQSNKAFLLDIKADDLSEVDLVGLEATAKAVAAFPATSPATAVNLGDVSAVPAGVATVTTATTVGVAIATA